MPTIDENPIARNPRGKVCPHCNVWIEHMDYQASYNEWGTEYGTKDCDAEYEECSDRQCSDSETNDSEYKCPECEEALDYDFFEDENADEGEEAEATAKPAPVITNPDTNSETEEIVARICPSCNYSFEDLKDDQVDSCIKCGYVFTVTNE